jgi:hypothetical protein
MFPSASYDPETLDVLHRVFDEVWEDVQGMIAARSLDPDAVRSVLARRILAAAAEGERDPRRFKLIAMGIIA